MRFDNAEKCSEVIWTMRIADLPRGDNRVILQRLFNGDPPFDPTKAEENNIEINRNDLSGVNLLSQARRQWNNAFIGRGIKISYDSGPVHKRLENGLKVSTHFNRLTRKSRQHIGQQRATGANTVLHGIGPVNWKDRRTPIPNPIAVGSLLIPSETEIDDFDNLPYFAIYRELTPAQLYERTHGVKVDPGWNMKLVHSEIKDKANQLLENTNWQDLLYMPEKVEELIKQDLGLVGSDSVPKIRFWDFFFREADDGEGWYRRAVLDWGIKEAQMRSYKTMPSRKDSEANGFLYTSKHRKYANSLSQILHCQFGDCSAYAPFKYHSIRSLGWMLWGVCDLQNRLHCKFSEAVFEQLMWFFRVAGENDFNRIKRANFTHMGVIPDGVRMLLAEERFKPDTNIVEMAFNTYRQRMSENAASYTQNLDRGQERGEKTATQVMAEVNSVNALVTAVLDLAYTYEDFKYAEIMRRMCIKHSKDPMARAFREACIKDGVDEEMLDAERMNIESEQVLSGGNKTLQMATVNFLNGIRKNLPPRGQRIVDHISVEAATDQPDLAEEMAPLKEEKPISDSAHDAQLSTERLMRGLPFQETPNMLYEDYVKVWLGDLTTLVGRAQQQGGMADAKDIAGFQNIAMHVHKFLAIMAQDDELKPRIKQYKDLLGKLENFIKAFAQRLAEKAKAGNGAQADPKKLLDVQLEQQKGQAKLQNMRESHATRTAQHMAQFELEEQRKDRQLNAEMRRENMKTQQEVMHNRLKSLTE